jgi:hypothetical protein
MIGRLDGDATGRFRPVDPLLRAPAACWWARALVESTLTSQVMRPAESARACNTVSIRFQVPLRCHLRNKAYTADQHP